MIIAEFAGWFECRLATDPDPADEKRGVSGYMKSLPGEPDLDRVIRFQNPIVSRSHCPVASVNINRVIKDDAWVSDHWLTGARVSLGNTAIFKGDNGVVAEDGFEPIFPLELTVVTDSVSLRRLPESKPEFHEFPYTGLQAAGIIRSPGEIAAATGITSVANYLELRRTRLEAELENENDPTSRYSLEYRINFLKSPVARRFFGAKMPYFVPLAGQATISDPNGIADGEISTSTPWTLDFWLGGWDPDACIGYAKGYVVFP
ncbi:hypothetical protein SH501x_004537 [Pirellulaceae bacterium SH501]